LLPFLKAVADERRLRILILLSGGERIVSDLQKALRVGQSLLSFHLRALKDTGLVSDRRDGRSVYALDPKALEELESFIHGMRSRPLAPWRRSRVQKTQGLSGKCART
jgi:ArsR family transcriptional regulator